MRRFFLFYLVLILSIWGCESSSSQQAQTGKTESSRGALLITRFKSFEDFKKTVNVEYFDTIPGVHQEDSPGYVKLTHTINKHSVTSILEPGVRESDFLKAKDGSFWDKAKVGLRTPFAVFNRDKLMKVEILARRRYVMFGEGDIAFYDLAESLVENISEEDKALMSEKDLSEKGYLNTFNHVAAQALMTSLFSEDLADYIADVHERNTLPALRTGKFTEKQLKDVENGAVDNYVDMINNEWGQELGKELKEKYELNDETVWTPELLANYLNDLQNYFSWTLHIGFTPFEPTDDKLIRFAHKINALATGEAGY